MHGLIIELGTTFTVTQIWMLFTKLWGPIFKVLREYSILDNFTMFLQTNYVSSLLTVFEV